MANFEAVAIEHRLGRFFGMVGVRGGFFDADVFRAGRPKELAEVLRRVADTLESRLAFIRFPQDGPGSSKAQTESCVFWLRYAAENLEKRRNPERENYHWEIFGAMLSGLTGLLETLEGQATVQ
jgi:hypothetical protein